jgi:hypothetical protein
MMQLERVRRQLDDRGGYTLPSGIRYTGLAARHAIEREMRAGGYEPESEWQNNSRNYRKKEK